MLGISSMLRGLEDPLEDHPRYEKIRWANCEKNNVQIALDREKNRNVAIKFFRRGPTISEDVRREILHHARLQHMHVVSLYHVFLTSSHLCIALELGEQNLWQYVHSKGGVLPEEEAQSMFLQILDGVQYCHSQRVVNRDIKLENCLVMSVFRRGTRHNIVKICDFGYCKNVETDSLPKSLVGTAAYISPDILNQTNKQGYDAMLVDIWTCGIVLYYLLEGRFPFGTEESNGGMKSLWQRIQKFDYDGCERASYGAQDLLSKIFCPPDLRIDLEGVWDHWWVQQGYKKNSSKKLKELQTRTSSQTIDDSQSLEDMEKIINEACVSLQTNVGGSCEDYLP